MGVAFRGSLFGLIFGIPGYEYIEAVKLPSYLVPHVYQNPLQT